MRAAIRHRLWLLLLGLCWSVLALAQAPSFELSAYIDNDSRPSTGCAVTLSDGTVLQGIEYQVSATAQGLPPLVTSVQRRICSGAALSAPATLGGGYPVGLNNGVNGGDVVEFAVPRFSVVPPANTGIRLYFVGTSTPRGGLDLLLTRDGSANGAPIFFGFAVTIPGVTQWGLMLLSLGLAIGGFVMLRRHPNARVMVVMLVLGSFTLTALAVALKSADGNVGDWTGITALATDPEGDGTTPEAGNDLRAAFLQIEGNDLLFRIDVKDLENQPPVAAPQAVTTLEDTFLDIVLSATDPEGSPVTFNIITGPTAGTLGTITQLTPTTASVRYTPNVDRNGSDSFIFSATDNGGATSAPATVSLTITPVNDAPRFTASSPPAVNEDSGAQTATVATGIAAGPATATDETSQTLTFNIVNNSNAALFSAAPTLSAAGVLTYTPAAQANGTAVLTVSLSDNGGTANGGVDTSATQTITITVTAVNDAPVNTVPGAQTLIEDTTLIFSTANNNLISTSDVDAGANPVLLTLGSPNGTLTLSGLAGLTGTGNGTGMLSYTGTVTAINTALAGLSFTPTANFNGAAAIAITVNDQGNTGGPAQSDTDNIAINITAVNDIPTFTGGASPTVLEDAAAQTVAGWATAINDGDTEVQTLTFQFTANSNAALFSAGPAVDPATGNLTYTLAANANGVANLTLVLRDNGGTAGGGIDTSVPYNFTITVTAVNDAPSYTASTPATVLEDAGAQTLASWATFNPGPANESAQTVVGYTVTAVGTPALFSAPPAVAANGTLTYTPAANANGSSTFTVTVQDNGGTANAGVDTSPPQTFTITVTAVNDAPSYTAGPTQTVLEDAGAQIVNPWATAISAGPANESGQTLTFNVTNNTNPALFSAAPAVAANGTLTYTPAANAFGTATISLQLMDDGGIANAGVNVSAVQTFVINVTAVDDAPVAVADAATVGEDSGATAVAVLTNDTDVDAGPISIAGITPPLNGTVVITGGGSGLTYAPNANYCNTAPVAAADTFGYSLTPGGSSATVSITVTCVNDAPVNTLPVTQNIGAGGSLTFNVANSNLISVADVDVGTSLLSISLSTGALANGTVSLTDLAGLATVTGNGTQTVTATGTLTAINASLEGLTYIAPAVPPGSGNATLTLITSDQGATGTGGAQTDTDSLTINIDNPPSVSTVAPTAGASNQGTGTGVTVTFSEPVAALANALNVSCAPSGGSANSVANANTTTLSVTGAAIGALAGDTCTVTVTAASITDIDTIDPPNAMLANFTSTYTIDTPPTVSSTTPANGATNVAANATITVNFSEAVNVTAGGFALSCSSGPALTLAPATLSNASTVTLTPSAALPPSATCTLTVNATNVTDNDAGDPPDNMAANFSASFTTVDPAPSVTTTTPANGGTGSAVADITVNFSEAVTFSAASFTLECPVATPFPFVVTGSGTTTATINPTGNLPVGTVCTVTVLATGIADVDAIDPPDNMAANVVFTFTAVNAPPVLTAGATTNYTEDGLAVVIDPTITVADSDNTSLTSATVEITTNFATGQDVLSFVNTANITGNYVAATGVLTLSGTDTLAAYQAALRSVRYSNTSDTPSILLRTIRWIGSDGVAPSAPVTSTVNVTATDDAPTAVADAATVVEDSGANAINVLTNDTDPDAGPISIGSVTQPANGTVVITGGGTGLTYAPNANYCNAPPGTTLSTFTYTLTPGSSSTTVTVTVTCVDDNPVAVADSATVVEDSGANAINVLANDTDVDAGPISVASVTQPANGSVVITGGGTGLTYAPIANYCNTPPGTTPDTFTYTLAPGASSTTVSVAVTCVDDPPVAVADSATVIEDSGANAIVVLTNDTDPDGGPKSISSVTQPANGVVVITGGGTGLTYAPNANYCNNPPGTTLSTFTYTLTPGGSSTTVTVTVTCVNDPPVFTTNPISYIAAGNTQLHVAGASRPGVANTVDANGVLAKSVPTDIDGPVAPAAVPATGTSVAGGNFQVFANGSFHYTPLAGFTGADSFVIAVTDSLDSSNLTVNVTVSEMVWYVRDLTDANNAAGGDGRSSNAFESLAAAETASGVNHTIFVFNGTTATTPLPGGITLKNGQKLHGEGIGLTLPTHGTLIPAGTRPRITNAGGTTVAVQTTGTDRTGIEIRGLSISSSNIGIRAVSNTTLNLGVLISDNVIESTGQQGIYITHNSTGTANLSVHDLTITSTGVGVQIERSPTAGLTSITAFDDIAVTGASANVGIVVTGGNASTPVVFDATPGGAFQQVSGGVTTIGQSGNGIGLGGLFFNNVSGDLAYTDLDVFSDSTVAVSATGTGVVNVAAGTGFRVTVPAGVSTIVAGAGDALQLSTLTADLQLALLTANSGGVSLTGVGNGTTNSTISAPAGSTISNATTTDFAISGGNANVTYGGTITDATGTVVSVASTTGGTKTFSGAITSGAVTLAANAGATINFTGGLVLSTGATTAFTATGGGTVNVTGAANTLTTTTGTALNVVNTTIGASGLIFRSVNVDGDDVSPTNGIVLNNTGATSGLTITGTGAAGTGGTIRDTSDDAILLTNTERVTLSSINITSNLGSGIGGSAVNGFDLNGLSITANGNSAADDESGINLANLTGSVAAGARPTRIVNSTISNNFEFEVQITNTTGTLTDLQMSGNSISSDGFQPNHGNLMNFLVSGGSTANMTLNVTSGSFTGNTNTSGGRIVTATGVQCDHSGTGGTMTCNIGGAAFTNNNVGPQASVAGGGQMVFDFNNNNIQGSLSHGVNVFADANPPFTKTINGRIRNNTVGTVGVTGSGSTVGFPIRVQNEGRISTTLAITGNQVRESVGFTGINVNHGISLTAGTSATNVTITGNTISDIDSGRAVLVQALDFLPAGGNAGTVCADIGGNTMTNIAGQAGDLTRIRIRQSASSAPSVFNVRQNAATAAAVVTELDDANGFNDLTQVSVGGTPTYNAGACPQPSN